jgi:RAQPRD family integrative conjugative element protein
MFKKAALLFALIANTSWALANDAQTITERQRLENVMSELAYIQTYLQTTKSSQKHNVRSRFDYQRAHGDFDLIINGISEYLSDIPEKPKSAAETYQAIEGNYTK